MGQYFSDFASAFPDAMAALWDFGDPSGIGQGWWGIVILLIWGIGLTAVPLYIAKITYEKHEWVSATMGTVAALSVAWWLFGILPSAWIYYVDANKEILQGAIIPASMGITFENGFLFFPEGYRLDIASNFYEVVRDSVVMIETGAATTLCIWGALRIQERFPRTLAPGESRPEAGGYK